MDTTLEPAKTGFWARYGKVDYEDDDTATTNVYPIDVDQVQPSYDIDSRLTVWHPITATEVEPSYETDTRLVVWN